MHRQEIPASVGTHFCSRSHGNPFSQGTLLLPVAHKPKARVGGKGRQAFSMLSMAWLSLPRSLRWAAEEFPDMYRLWLLLHCLRPLLGPLVAHCKGTLSGGWRQHRRWCWARRGPPALLSGLGEVVTTDLDLFSLQRGYPEVTLMDCMRLFTKEDILDGDEKPVSHSSVPGWGRATKSHCLRP